MQTFAELLTEYAERTGISDIELARSLGVRRQTIFRWKEGLVDRPRYRDDVLRCAEKLRLTPEERDQLLLAAGFPPEGTLVAAPETILAAPDKQAEAPVKRKPALWPKRLFGRRLPRWTWLVAAIFALAFVTGAVYLANSSLRLPVAPAAPGETLIIIGSFDPPVQAGQATPTANPRFSSDVVSSTASVNTRIQAALDREIRAARLDRVRIEILPDRIADAVAAEQMRRRTNAAVVVWGSATNDIITVAFTSASIPARTNELPLDALVVTPSDLYWKIYRAAPEETRSLAFLILSQLYLNHDDYTLAGAALTQALAQPLRDTDSLVRLYFFSGYIRQISKPPDQSGAIELYSQVINHSPEMVSAYLNRGLAYVRQHDSAQWQTDFARVLALKLDDFGARQALCWAYALDKKPEQALVHCDSAVSRDPSARSREPRALVYIQLGRLADATSDLQIFVDWLAHQPADLRARYGSSREEWLQTLKAGQHPVDDALLEKLRRE
jgi:tetratricopeptide (TPR) repeat protein